MLCRSCKSKEDKRKEAFYARDPEASRQAHDTYVAKEKHKKYRFIFFESNMRSSFIFGK
jgi:hypothetical protein